MIKKIKKCKNLSDVAYDYAQAESKTRLKWAAFKYALWIIIQNKKP